MKQKFENKFVRLGEGWLCVHKSGKDEYQEAVDKYARDGWRLVQIGGYGETRNSVHLKKEGSESVTKCNRLTDYWKDHEIKGEDEYAILTNIIHEEWSGVSVKKHKHIKGLKNQNLRDVVKPWALRHTQTIRFVTVIWVIWS